MKTLALLSAWLALPVLALASGTSAAGAARSLDNTSHLGWLVPIAFVALLIAAAFRNPKSKTLASLGLVLVLAIALLHPPRVEALAGGGPCSACENTGVPEEVKVVGGMLIFWVVALSAIGL